MIYSEYLAKKNYHLMPKSEQTKIKQNFVKQNFGKDLSTMNDIEQESLLIDLNKKLTEVETKYLDANMGPQLPVDKQNELDQNQKILYQRKILEDTQRAVRDGASKNTFTDFASKVYNAISGDLKKSPSTVLAISELLNPANLSQTFAYLETVAGEARKQQAREFLQASGEKELSGTQFPDVLLRQGADQSGPARLLETFNKKYNFNKKLPGAPVPNFGAEFTPKDRSGRILYGLGSIAPDLPLFLSGPMKGFALSKMITTWADARERGIKEGHDVTWGDVVNVAIEGTKGGAVGAFLGATGYLSSFATGRLQAGIANALMSRGMQGASKIAEKMVSTLGTTLGTGAEALTLTVSEGVMNLLMPTSDAQREHGFDLSMDNVIDGALTIGIMKAGNKLSAKIVDPVTNEVTTKMKIGKKIGEIETDINQTFKGGDPKIINELFSKKIRRELSPVEIRELSSITGKSPQEILNADPKSFQSIGRSYRKHLEGIITDAPADVLAKFDSDIADFQGVQLKEKIISDLTPGKRGITQDKIVEKVKDKIPVEKVETKVDTALDNSLNRIYGKGVKGSSDSLASVKEHLTGNNKIINKGTKDGSKIEVLKAKSPEVKDVSGNDVGSMDLSPIPLSKGDVGIMRGMKDLVFSPVTEKFQNASKRIATLGPKVKEAFVEVYRDARSSGVKDARAEKDFSKKFFKELKLSSKEIENVGMKMMMEQGAGPATLKRMGKIDKVPEKLSASEQKLYEYLTERFKTMASMHNEARILSGLEPMNTVDNYMPIVRKFTLRERLGLSNKGELLTEEMFFNEMLSKDPATFSKTRQFTDRAAELNIVETYLKYVDEFYKSTYELPVLGKMRKMINPVETVDGEKIWIKDTAPRTHEFLKKYIEYLEGVPQYENNLFNTAMTKLSKNLGRSIIGGNLRSVASQAAASWGMLTEMPRFALKNADKMLNPKAWTEAFQKSRMLADRVVDVSYADAAGSPISSIKNLVKHPIDAITQAAFAPMRVVDITFATWSWHTAYSFAKSKGMPERKAVRYADQKMIDWNASAAKEDLAPIQRTPAGKAFTLFQTHPINQINWIGRDLIGLRFKEVPFEGTKTRPAGMKRKLDISESFLRDPKKAIKLINLIAVGTGISYIYEKGFGLYSPIPAPGLAFMGVDDKGSPIPLEKSILKMTSELMSLMPIGSTAEWGGSGAFGAQFAELWNFAESLAGAMNDKRRGSTEDLYKHVAVILGVPGAKQFIREYRKFEKKQKSLSKIKDPKRLEREFDKEGRKLMSEFRKHYKEQLSER